MRIKFQLTDQQRRKLQNHPPVAMPSDEWFKNEWARLHRGKKAGWGMLKRDWILNNMKFTEEYQTGLWQGRLDRAMGLDYAEERLDAPYNLGYHRGYTGYESDSRGWDAATREWFNNLMEAGNE